MSSTGQRPRPTPRPSGPSPPRPHPPPPKAQATACGERFATRLGAPQRRVPRAGWPEGSGGFVPVPGCPRKKRSGW
ncbi:hypothetical protein B9Z47_06705 [Limnohabitans sp. 2KL-1]|nr:hypothetical protein B9Z47_06705 [Limnohabitans sp. 2KL-1]